jgi:FAD/FMN-containing dehydrogenase
MLLDELKAIVGAGGWITDEADLQLNLTEWRDSVRGRALVMVSPSTTAQVAEIVTACAQAGVGIVPQGGNTGLCGGAIPDQTGEQVLLSLSKMNAVRQVDPDDFSIVVEAGCILSSVQDVARDAQRFFPLSLASEGSCQIGGNLATNAGGINVIRYGTARDQVLGLEVVLANGTIWNGLRSLRKNTAGYDLKHLFVGSEGTLGIITAATLRLFPDPGEVATAMVALESAEQAVKLLARLRRGLTDRIQAFELISSRAMRFVTRNIDGARLPFDKQFPWFVLLDVAIGDDGEVIEGELMQALEDGLCVEATIAKSLTEANEFWHLRHTISEAQKSEGASLKHDISVPIGKMHEFLCKGDDLLTDIMPEARLVAFGHVGDGNLHYNVSQPANADVGKFQAAAARLTDAIYTLVSELGGSISAEHGIGTMKKDHLSRFGDPTEIELMGTLKRALDPQNILNPGKVI